jgi:CRISPR-associated protein Csh1
LGFLNATFELGNQYLDSYSDEENKYIDSFLQLPMPVISDDKKAGRVIRVWLNVIDINVEKLEVRSIEKIDSTDYLQNADGKKRVTEKRKYLYRNPTGSATPWKFSPVYKLGKGVNNTEEELIGKKGEWSKDKNSRFYKLKRTVLDEFENMGYLAKGSVDLIMQELQKRIDRFSELWNDKNRSYIMVFGVNDNGKFVYPGQITAFRSYFRAKLSDSFSSDVTVQCGLCHESSSAGINLDKVFKFATFDKSSFLPGTKEGKGVAEKVFPICPDCLSSLSMGREVLDNYYLDGKTIHGMYIYVVPELLFDQNHFEAASTQAKNFLKKGLSASEYFFNLLAKQDNSLVFHFLFWERNQAQERLHLMVEDVPPSRLKRLEEIWEDTYRSILWNKKNEPQIEYKKLVLDAGIRTVFNVLTSLSGKNDREKEIMKDRVIGLLGKLLGDEKIDLKEIKLLMTSRFPGLFSDTEWLRYAGFELRKMMAVTEFITKANRR